MVTALVVKSWNSGNASAWGQLNTTWPQHGNIPIAIDTQTLGGAPSFTYEDLLATNADVVILSDPAGGLQQFSEEEVSALDRYLAGGHNLIGTFKTFVWNDVDNSALVPLFGFAADFEPISPPISNRFFALSRFDPLTEEVVGRAGDRLLRRVPSWLSSGYAYTETPGDDLRWGADDLEGAKIVAQSDDFTAIVSVFSTADYVAVFFSNMPEYFGSAIDRQILYNAIVYPNPQTPR